MEGPIYAPHAQYMLECPDLFCIEDTWYLTYSWDCVTYYAIGESMNGPFTAPEDNILDGMGMTGGNGFIFYAAKTARFNGSDYLCGWIGRSGLSADSGVYQWAGNVLIHQLVRHEDGTLGVKAPDSFDDYFTVEKPLSLSAEEGDVDTQEGKLSLSAQPGAYALVDLGTRPATMTLECDVTLDEDGCAGFAFGGSEGDPAYTALCLDAGRNLLHYEGYEITEIQQYDPAALTRFDFASAEVHHVKLVCENEIVVLYIDDTKALSSRITHSIDGAHLALFADGCQAAFSNLSVKVPG